MKEREREKGKDGGSGGVQKERCRGGGDAERKKEESDKRKWEWKGTKIEETQVGRTADCRVSGSKINRGMLSFFIEIAVTETRPRKPAGFFFKGIFCPSVKQIIQIVSLEVCELVLSWNKKRTLCILSSQWQLGVHRCCLAVRMSLYLLPLFASWFLRQIWFFQRFGVLWRTFTSTEWNVLPWSLTPS